MCSQETKGSKTRINIHKKFSDNLSTDTERKSHDRMLIELYLVCMQSQDLKRKQKFNRKHNLMILFEARMLYSTDNLLLRVLKFLIEKKFSKRHCHENVLQTVKYKQYIPVNRTISIFQYFIQSMFI